MARLSSASDFMGSFSDAGFEFDVDLAGEDFGHGWMQAELGGGGFLGAVAAFPRPVCLDEWDELGHCGLIGTSLQMIHQPSSCRDLSSWLSPPQ